ncbi:MAG: VWA domain-containing protein [Rhodanobacter sp.]
MSAGMQQFHFLQPWWLLALCVLPLAWWIGTRRTAASAALTRLVDPALLPHLLRGERSNRSLPTWLFLAAWTLATVALAGPAWNRQAQPLYAERTAQVVAISLSQHMLARDVAPSRIDRARFKARELLTANHDGLNALIAYAGEAFVVAPLTSDAHSLNDLLAALAPNTMPVDGNDAASAIQRAVSLVRDGKADAASLVLITDQADAAAVTAAAKARTAGLRVSVLGVGTPHGGPVPEADGGLLHDAQGNLVLPGRDDAELAAVAAAGGGRYVAMSSDHSDIDVLHAQLRNGTSTPSSTHVGDTWQDRGPWLLLPLLLLVALAFRRGWLCLLALVLLPVMPGTAHAGTWSDLWQRRDQQAVSALHRGDAKRAQQLARDPAWRGATAYRAGDFTAAARALERVPGATAAYNLGNALARQGKYPEAISAYDHALKLDPALADAQANRKSVEDWLRQHKPPPQKPGQAQDQQSQQHEGQDQQAPGQQAQGSQQPGQQAPKESQSAGSGDGADKPTASADGQGEKQQAGAGAHNPQPPTTADQPQGAASTASPLTPKSEGDADNAQPPAPTPQQQAAQRARAAQAQQALREQMDQALAGKPSTQAPATHELGSAAADDPESKLPADVRRALQSVPDDPGALLRRKFELEYQRRHGGVPSAQEQP